MKRKVTYIPTLQEYMKKRKKQRVEFLEIKSCLDCDYFRKDNDVCLWGNSVKVLTALEVCPITSRDL